MKQIIFVLFSFLFLNSCKGQQDNGQTYNKSFITGEIPNKQNFLNLSDHEKFIDSLLCDYDKKMDSLAGLDKRLAEYMLKEKRDFINNRSRIYLASFTNNKPGNIDSAFYRGMPAPCDCWFNKDSIFISMAIGFFGGMTFYINLERDNFQSGLYLFIDGVKPYKANLKDRFTSHIKVGNKFQYLVLENKPSFIAGQQLSGYLTMTTSNFYEQVSNIQLDTNYYQGKIYFTCITKKNPGTGL